MEPKHGLQQSAAEIVKGLYDAQDIFDQRGEGDCLFNVKRLMTRATQDFGASMEGWKAAYIHWTGPREMGWGIFPNKETLRTGSEGLGMRREGGGIVSKTWGRHVILLDPSNNVYDLSAKENMMGSTISDYMQHFIPEHFRRRVANRFKNDIAITLVSASDMSTINSFSEFEGKGKTIELDDIIDGIQESLQPGYLEQRMNEDLDRVNRLYAERPNADELIRTNTERIQQKYLRRHDGIDALLHME